MQMERVRGIIRRRLLVNFRVDPAVISRLLPAPFRPKLHAGSAVAGICLIRLEEVRPLWAPRLLGVSSENAAHRIAIEWDDEHGAHEGVFIPRRDTGSVLNHFAGGRLFAGEHNRAEFQVADDRERVSLEMLSADGRVTVKVVGQQSASLPATSMFDSLQQASNFFEPGSVGYSVTRAGLRLDKVALKTEHWSVAPLAIEHVSSSFFSDATVFPEGSAAFDCALVMRDVAHEWHAGPPMSLHSAG
jgi:hypothetical protein